MNFASSMSMKSNDLELEVPVRDCGMICPMAPL